MNSRRMAKTKLESQPRAVCAELQAATFFFFLPPSRLSSVGPLKKFSDFEIFFSCVSAAQQRSLKPKLHFGSVDLLSARVSCCEIGDPHKVPAPRDACALWSGWRGAKSGNQHLCDLSTSSPLSALLVFTLHHRLSPPPYNLPQQSTASQLRSLRVSSLTVLLFTFSGP